MFSKSIVKLVIGVELLQIIQLLKSNTIIKIAFYKCHASAFIYDDP